MKFEEFWKKHTEIIKPRGIYFLANCDLWSQMDGYIYYLDDDFVCSIQGVMYNREGDSLVGDFEGYLDLLKNEIDSYLQNKENRE